MSGDWWIDLIYAAGLILVSCLVFLDERRDRLAELADTEAERIREALADIHAEAIALTRRRDPDPDIAQWQDELDNADG